VRVLVPLFLRDAEGGHSASAAEGVVGKGNAQWGGPIAALAKGESKTKLLMENKD